MKIELSIELNIIYVNYFFVHFYTSLHFCACKKPMSLGHRKWYSFPPRKLIQTTLTACMDTLDPKVMGDSVRFKKENYWGIRLVQVSYCHAYDKQLDKTDVMWQGEFLFQIAMMQPLHFTCVVWSTWELILTGKLQVHEKCDRSMDLHF